MIEDVVDYHKKSRELPLWQPIPEEVLEKIMEELNPLKPNDAEACATK